MVGLPGPILVAGLEELPRGTFLLVICTTLAE
jgi:hypothetical protein